MATFLLWIYRHTAVHILLLDFFLVRLYSNANTTFSNATLHPSTVCLAAFDPSEVCTLQKGGSIPFLSNETRTAKLIIVIGRQA